MHQLSRQQSQHSNEVTGSPRPQVESRPPPRGAIPVTAVRSSPGYLETGHLIVAAAASQPLADLPIRATNSAERVTAPRGEDFNPRQAGANRQSPVASELNPVTIGAGSNPHPHIQHISRPRQIIESNRAPPASVNTTTASQPLADLPIRATNSAERVTAPRGEDFNPRQARANRQSPVASELNPVTIGAGSNPHPHIQHISRPRQLIESNRAPPASVDSANTTSRQIESRPGALFTGLRRVPVGFRVTLTSDQSVVATMAALDTIERRRVVGESDEEALDPERESGVDRSQALPQPPPLSRRRSTEETRTPEVQISRKDNSLLDLRNIRQQYMRVACWDGTSNPEVVFRILEFYPEIEQVIMAPALPANHKEYSPHVMKMVSPDCADVMNYCVITRTHVIRYIKGKQPKKMTLKRWAFEQNTVIKLREIPFFKNFKMIKAFNALGHHVDMSTFGRCRRRLRSRLFACDPLLADMLLLVRTMCLDMAQLSLIQVDKELTYTISEFMEEQEHFTRDVTSKLERCQALLIHLTARTCWDDVIAAGLAVERAGRKISAPKRISEMRKLQRLRQR
ncbi:hypothetical protein EGW08_021771 [Elysia chlorotica]|uniref:Uncharacterized protein n=1 Tax=Elysia chlorotica TaxID=188477 RepID=A0A433SMS9_ELYCH|nr:hypothetical protein EGW08_021771 [Elysia chlorotica]